MGLKYLITSILPDATDPTDKNTINWVDKIHGVDEMMISGEATLCGFFPCDTATYIATHEAITCKECIEVLEFQRDYKKTKKGWI